MKNTGQWGNVFWLGICAPLSVCALSAPVRLGEAGADQTQEQAADAQAVCGKAVCSATVPDKVILRAGNMGDPMVILQPDFTCERPRALAGALTVPLPTRPRGA
jgi:hypothetical protein